MLSALIATTVVFSLDPQVRFLFGMGRSLFAGLTLGASLMLFLSVLRDGQNSGKSRIVAAVGLAAVFGCVAVAMQAYYDDALQLFAEEKDASEAVE